MTAIGPGPHRGSLIVIGSSLDQVIEDAVAQIRQFVADREIFLTTDSQPAVKSQAGETLVWEVQIEWSVKVMPT